MSDPDFSVAEDDDKSKKKLTRNVQKKWTPIDDMTLKDGIQGSSNFQKLARSLRFSVRFTALELEQRWRQLLYDPEISEMSTRAMSELPYCLKRAMWSEKEEEIITREINEGVLSFQDILDNYRPFFHPVRSARSIEAHCIKKKLGKHRDIGGNASKKMKMAKAETVQPPSPHKKLTLPSDQDDNISANFNWDAYPGCIAYLFWKTIIYLNGEKEVVIGRCKNDTVDVNLRDDEGSAAKISRRQAVISYDADSKTFSLKNIGRARVMVDDRGVEREESVILPAKSTLYFNEFKLAFQMAPPRKEQQNSDFGA